MSLILAKILICGSFFVRVKIKGEVFVALNLSAGCGIPLNSILIARFDVHELIFLS